MLNILQKVDPKVVGARLQEARRARNFTQQYVATAMDIARTTVVAIEKGERRITSQELVALSGLYGISVSRLLKMPTDSAISDFVPQFRHGWREAFESEPELERVASDLQRFAEDFVELEHLNEMAKTTKDNPQYSISGLSPEQAGEEIAIAERNRLGIGDGPISNLRERLEMDVGLRVFYFEMPSGVSGIFAYSDSLGGCVGINSKHPRDRRHWSLGHEYGHYLTTRFNVEITFLRNNRRLASSERFADAFAENFLMPASGLNRRFTEMTRSTEKGMTMAEICQLADLYQVSVQALVLRLENLRRVPSGTWEHLAHNGFKTREAQRILGINANPPIDELPRWYMKLAVMAFEKGEVSEGQLARYLRTDRLTARLLVEGLSSNYQEKENGFVNVEIDFAQEIVRR